MILHTTIKGTGEPVIFLHSRLETGITDFEYQCDQLCDQFQVILPDLRGHGNSFSDEFNHFFEITAQDLAETMDHLQVKEAHIIGSDLGAFAGIILARNHPHRVKSLTVSGIYPKKPARWKQLHRKETEKQRRLLRDKTQIDYYNLLHNTNWREFIYLARNPDWYPFYLSEGLADLRVPVLFIAGESVQYEASGASIYGAYPYIHKAVLPFAGHSVHKDQPVIYNHILLQFLRKKTI
ncbi:Pimeloyl-ACP methyl ester carboxylesterase [Halobacillus alkaliphilus]|uniref:Pimeloyl-ACP methyl ester carboxylesterase n=1 Tax=Halobacillus alkaliphilus TaxID=396056 RepID=A0A1I2LUA1_9BACI|nr:alpha/beta hydrolase [Halobacillus alkaliphilus]SFF82733.1 Pimeloyl-ACP methyl ester carboxylesterase [Halobacillus alkaliphilus]